MPPRRTMTVCLAFRRDRRGNVAVMSALLLTVVMGFAALGVDLGKAFTDRRKAQSTVDLASLAAVNDLFNASKAANATVRGNGFPDGTSVSVELGIYTADPAVAAASRFKPAAGGLANAARVTLQASTPLFFGKALIGRESFTFQTRAIATQASFAQFAIGSRLLNIDNKLLNQILGGMLGSSLSLSVMDYRALADVRIDLFNFMNATATRAQLTGPTYDSVLKSNVRIGSVLDGMTDAGRQAAGSTSTAARALSDIAQSFNGSNDKMKLEPVLDIGPYKSLPLGQKPKVGVSASALDLLTATAQVANGQHQVETELQLGIPGIAAATLKLAVGERPVGTSWVTVGAVGAKVHTAQTRILLTVQLAGSGSIGAVNVPVYVEVAAATATLDSVKCNYANSSASSVTLGVTPAIVDAWIGDVSNAQFNNFKSAPSPAAATLVNLPLIKVTGRAHATMSDVSPQSVTFTQSDISQQTKKTVSTRDFTSSLTSRLVGDLQLNANIAGLGLGLPQVVTGQVAGILASATSPVDQLLAGVLATLGVGLGQADVWVSGIRCDGAVLVN